MNFEALMWSSLYSSVLVPDLALHAPSFKPRRGVGVGPILYTAVVLPYSTTYSTAVVYIILWLATVVLYYSTTLIVSVKDRVASEWGIYPG